MSVRSAIFWLTCFLTGLLLLSSPVLAQVRILPSTEFDHVNTRKTKSAQIKLESMQASNDFESILSFREGSRYRRTGKPIGRLKVKVRNSSGRTGVALCTASIISEEFILTNNHCIPGSPTLTVVSAKIEMDYLDAKNTAMVRTYKVDIKPVQTSKKLDFSIVRVFGNPSKHYGTVRLARGRPRVQDAVFIIHHPEGAPMTLSRKDCWVNALSGVNFIHTCDTLGGSSGSPVFSDETFEMVGLHFAGSSNGNYGKQLTEIRLKSRILESIVVKSSSSKRPGSRTTTADTAKSPPKVNISTADTADTASSTTTAAKRADPTPPPPKKRRPPPVSVAFDSIPRGAAIYFHGVVMGVTPHFFKIVPMKSYSFTLKKRGYAPKVENLIPKDGRIAKIVTLVESNDPVDNTPPPAVDPAADQMNKALSVWDNIEKNGWLSAPPKKPGQKSSKEIDQIRQGNKLFKSFGN